MSEREVRGEDTDGGRSGKTFLRRPELERVNNIAMLSKFASSIVVFFL